MSASQKSLNIQPYTEELDLGEVFRALWSGRWLIGCITVSVTIIAIIIAIILPNIYRAEALLAPNAQDGAGGLSALAAQYGGLASLAGINIGNGQVDKTALGIEIIKSRKFISEFIARRDILVPLIAAKKWNSKTGELVLDPDDFDAASNKWVRDVRAPKQAVPSAQEGYEAFEDILSVYQNKKTGFITVSIEHYSPVVAKEWVDWLVEDLNTSMMRQDVAEAEQAIEYLNVQISNTSVADLRSVFFNLIEEQTKTVMLAKVTREYLFKTLDPAVVPEKKAKPGRFLIVALAALLSFVFAIAGVLASAAFRRREPA